MMTTTTSAGLLPAGATPAKCRTCGAPIFWALTPQGRDCPFDAEPVDDGKYVAGSYHRKIAMERAVDGKPGRRYNSHFATCPQAAEHSKKAKRR